MSFTVDDLVASLSTNHIGQEAIDLAALQVQLSQSLLSATHDVASNAKYAQGHCNTPMARTPSSSFGWAERGRGELVICTRNSRSSSVVGAHRPRHNSIDEQGGYFYNADIEESYEDEQMVEDMLCSSSPVSPSSHLSQHTRASGGICGFGSSPPSPITTSDNQFTTTDPFYLAQLQQQRQQAQTILSSPSLFSQLGRPTPHSPFFQTQTQPQYHCCCPHQQQFPTCEVEHHHHPHAHQFAPTLWSGHIC